MTIPPLHVRILMFGAVCAYFGSLYGAVDFGTWYYELFGALMVALWIIAAWMVFFIKELKEK